MRRNKTNHFSLLKGLKDDAPLSLYLFFSSYLSLSFFLYPQLLLLLLYYFVLLFDSFFCKENKVLSNKRLPNTNGHLWPTA